jgi:nitroreductase
VYHFDPRDPALGLLRAGDHRAQLVEASGGEPAVAQAPVVIVCAGTYWRNSWKYRARTYRHFGWDNGTILANALATAAALGLPARVVSGFVDADVNALLALDTAREVAFSLLALGRGGPAPPPAPPLDPIHPRTAAGSRSEVDEPRIREVHEASSLASPDEVRAWRADAAGARSAPGPRGEHRVPLRSLPQGPAPTDALEDVVLRRGSTREFARGASLGLDQLSTLLERSTRGVPADFAPGGALLNRCYLIASAVDGLDAGAYVLHRDPGQLELLKRGEFRAEAGYLGLEQDLPADASAVVFFLADLDGELSRLGRRVYRALQLEAGILGGKMYLAAYAQRFGASGLTFYDDDVVRFFSPHAAGLAAVFVMALGRGAPLPAHGRVEPFVPVTFAPPAADRP